MFRHDDGESVVGSLPSAHTQFLTEIGRPKNDTPREKMKDLFHSGVVPDQKENTDIRKMVRKRIQARGNLLWISLLIANRKGRRSRNLSDRGHFPGIG